MHFYKIEIVQLSFGISVIDMEQNMSNNILNYLFLAELKPFLFVIDFSQDRIISLFPRRSTIQHRLVNKRFTFSGVIINKESSITYHEQCSSNILHRHGLICNSQFSHVRKEGESSN